MIFIQTVRDRYTNSSLNAESDPNGSGWSIQPFIRRPTRGIQIKEDTFATIRVVAAEGGKNKSLVDAGSRRKDANGNFLEIDGKRATDIYSNFLLQQVQEERMEKQQILETFGEAYIFLFGQRARVISFQGILANTFDFNWEAEWWHNYENYLRGTKCVENDARVYISYDNTLVGGYIIGTSSSKDSMNKNHVQFQFQLFVTYYSNFSSVGDPSAFAGDGSIRGLTIGKQLVSGDFTQDDLAQYRPRLLTDIPIQVDPLQSGQTKTLFEGLESGISKVKGAWGQAQQVANSALSKISGFMNPDGGVRVPVGFAGSLVFSEEPDQVTKLDPATIQELEGRIQYTTFSDNDDEYVGVGTQYGTDTWWNAVRGFGETTQSEVLNYGNDMVERAKTQWEQAGYTVPDVALGPVAKFLTSKSLGLVAVGATAGFQSSSKALQPGSADPASFAGNLSHAAVPVGVPAPPVPPIE